MANFLPPQDVFAEVKFGQDTSLHVHHRPEGRSDRIAIFVHGLGGAGYATWQGLLAQVYHNKGLAVDIGVFDYVTAIRRIREPGGGDIRTNAELLAQEIRDLPYKHVDIVAHSMGGLLARAAVRHLWEFSNHDSRKSPQVRGIIYVASPILGIRFIPALVALGLKDAYALSADTDYLRETNYFFSNHVAVSSREAASHDKWFIPSFSLLASGDRWVKGNTSLFAAPQDQVERVKGSHTSIAKWTPGHTENLRRIIAFLSVFKEKERKRRYLAPKRDARRLITRLSSHPSSASWSQSYLDACEQVSASMKMNVHPMSPGSDEIPDVDLVVVSSEGGVAQATSLVSSVFAEQQRHSVEVVGAAIQCADLKTDLIYLDVSNRIDQSLGLLRYVESFLDSEELRNKIYD